MVNEHNVLLVDIGNTRIKSITLDKFDGEVWSDASLTDLFARIVALKVDFVFLASVRDDTISDSIQAFCAENQVQFYEVKTEKAAFGIHNSYQNETTMGVDRWLAMIGAASLTDGAFVVIDIGTAMTVDFVVDNQHLGGWITPGYDTMKTSLIAATKRVFSDQSKPDDLNVGDNTSDCVSFGCLAAIQGVYLSAIDYLSSKQTQFAVILSGGDKKLFANVERSDSIHVANLVVHGLARYARRKLNA